MALSALSAADAWVEQLNLADNPVFNKLQQLTGLRKSHILLSTQQRPGHLPAGGRALTRAAVPSSGGRGHFSAVHIKCRDADIQPGGLPLSCLQVVRRGDRRVVPTASAAAP